MEPARNGRICTELLSPASAAASSRYSTRQRGTAFTQRSSFFTESPAASRISTWPRPCAVGFHVLTFHYAEIGGATGSYSLRNDLEDAQTVLDFVLSDGTYGFDKNRIYAVGHSLGGFVCGQLTARPEIKGGVLLMPCDIGRIRQISLQSEETAARIRDVLEDSSPLAERSHWGSAFTRGERIQPAALPGKRSRPLAKKPLLCITGTLDTCTPGRYHCSPLMDAIRAEGGRLLKSLEFPTDHFFSDYRLTVAACVTEFLEELAGIRPPARGSGTESACSHSIS